MRTKILIAAAAAFLLSSAAGVAMAQDSPSVAAAEDAGADRQRTRSPTTAKIAVHKAKVASSKADTAAEGRRRDHQVRRHWGC